MEAPVPVNISLNYMDYVDYYTHFLETKSDPRTAKWLLMSSPGPTLTILGTYLYFCVYAGPRYMKDKKPYDLKNTIILYNGVQVLLSIFLVHEGLVSGWANGYSFSCQPVDFSNDSKAVRMAGAVWWYFMCKLIELLDTVFFVLRKKTNQVSFLHLYHHTMMPVCSWIGVKFLPGGHGTLLGLINSFIHILMYSYYFMSSLGPQYHKYLWWKRHLTELQMIQFCLVAVHNFQMLFRPCEYPKGITLLLGIQAIFFLYLFGSFYYRSYVKAVPAPHKKPSLNEEGRRTVKENGTQIYGKIKATPDEGKKTIKENGIQITGKIKATPDEDKKTVKENGIQINGKIKTT